MSQGIKSKVVVITGASSGIGAASARYLAARGAVVSLAARRKDKLDALVGEIVKAGGKAQAYSCDVTEKEQVKAVVDATVKDHGKLDVIINNAGIMPIRPIQECNTEEWDAMSTSISRVSCMASLRHCRSSLSRIAASSST